MLELDNIELRRMWGDGACAYYFYMASCSACGVVDRVLDHKLGDRRPDDSQMHILLDFKNARFLRAVAVRSLLCCDWALDICRIFFGIGTESN
eukprot:604724-Pleurochrysis_carterae.AAC.1